MTLDITGDPAGVRLQRLCHQSARATSVDGGSVALATAPAARVVLSATDHVAVALEELQIALGEGPYVDAVSSVVPVLAPDLGDPSTKAAARWPFFAREAKALDVAALFAFPIRVSAVPVATFGLYRRSPGALTTLHLGTALTAAEGIAETLLDNQTWAELPPGKPPKQPSTEPLIASTALVHQAAGMVMLQLDGTIEEALVLLRATAFAESTALGDLAREVVTRRRRFGRGELDA